MGDLKRVAVGEKVSEWPCQTWDALVDGELRDRARGPRKPNPGDATKRPEPGSARVRIKNASGSAVGHGKVLALGAPLILPADNADTVLDCLQFSADTPTASSRHLVIVSGPIADGEVGWGAIPNAAWARVNVTSEAHTSAKAAATNVLASAGAGPFGIIWKESGTGEKWAVVSLGGGGGGQGEVVQALLVKSMAATTVNGVAGTLTPSAVVESAVIVLVEPDDPTAPMTGETGDDDELLLLDAVNRAWLREITAGDGSEQLDEEDEPTGVYNATPKLVYGFKTTYTATVGEGEEATEEERDLFVITDVQNPPRIFRGTTTAEVNGGDWDMDGLDLLWGDPLPTGQTTMTGVDNPDNWDGPDNGVALGIETPEGDNEGLDLACPT